MACVPDGCARQAVLMTDAAGRTSLPRHPSVLVRPKLVSSAPLVGLPTKLDVQLGEWFGKTREAFCPCSPVPTRFRRNTLPSRWLSHPLGRLIRRTKLGMCEPYQACWCILQKPMLGLDSLSIVCWLRTGGQETSYGRSEGRTETWHFGGSPSLFPNGLSCIRTADCACGPAGTASPGPTGRGIGMGRAKEESC
jgi:hypothetical protein